MRLLVKKGILCSFEIQPKKYSGAALYDGDPSTHGIIFSEFLNTSPVPQTDGTLRPPIVFSGLDCFQSVCEVELRR